MAKSSIQTSLLLGAALISQAAFAQNAPSIAGPSASSAPAAADPNALAEVVVYGQRRGAGESLQKVPIAITALDATALRSSNTVNIADLAACRT